MGWRHRFGLRSQLAAGSALLLVVIVVGGNAYLAGQYSPAGAVTHYFKALQAGDASSAWASIQVADPTGTVDAKLIDSQALRAALAVRKPSFPGLSTGKTTVNGTAAQVEVSYQFHGATLQRRAQLVQTAEKRLGFYPTWRVVVAPTILNLAIPAGVAVTIDGKPVAIAPNKRQAVAVFPLAHRVQL
ncbi:MAG: hypothetical protein E6J32_13680, partial [Chloroflexi bacterium]